MPITTRPFTPPMTTRRASPGYSRLVWSVGGAIAAIALGWIAARLHIAGFAPLGLLPLSIGIALGAILSALARATQLTSWRPLLLGAVLFAVLAVMAEHAWLYRDYHRQWHVARNREPRIAIFRPEPPLSLSEYFGRELTPQRAALWAVDGALIIAAAVGTVCVLRRENSDLAALPPAP